MAEKRELECSECGTKWQSQAKPENVAAGKIKCKECACTKIIDAAAIEAEPQQCGRCNGDGIWHSTKTGYRAKTAAEPLVDPTRKCPACGGTGTI